MVVVILFESEPVICTWSPTVNPNSVSIFFDANRIAFSTVKVEESISNAVVDYKYAIADKQSNLPDYISYLDDEIQWQKPIIYSKLIK